ncbi:hypothetical protein Pint_11755 [Pistacia integerrima]|uniref:Uncharacterized protein n=1 Tax=Pistacia integerrima TaxID=434235 RepID=A0ACC0XKR9_9ROSI|nr:hypothetical protein Pint_11755 [Pistacia integerrima]
MTYIASPATFNDASWYLRGGVLDHITSQLSNLSVHSEFQGSEKLAVATYPAPLELIYAFHQNNVIVEKQFQVPLNDSSASGSFTDPSKFNFFRSHTPVSVDSIVTIPEVPFHLELNMAPL